ncbi:Uncharacterized protein TCAP_00011 [Tolypocladium capitatum]|uniref:Fumarylacetoacetase-like C-terminal domain-containing protein n=1 Tax=Tolypocladium capitatum TaxID=45235 RepID=A0A2K3QRC9_9HYPO|nr:Uncharacterized protein TCAP_00011 [Tolypocladium capitatum]
MRLFHPVREIGTAPPPYPTIFIKAPTAVHDHGRDVMIPEIAQDEQADYEGELVIQIPRTGHSECIIIGKDAKNISGVDALDYVAAYTASNDVSSRKLQSKPELAGPIPQACFSKGFDTYTPLGPTLVATSLIPDPSTMRLETRIDGQVRQTGHLNDLPFSDLRQAAGIRHRQTGRTSRLPEWRYGVHYPRGQVPRYALTKAVAPIGVLDEPQIRNERDARYSSTDRIGSIRLA